MSDFPIRFRIAIAAKEPLPKPVLRDWIRCVRENGPDGAVLSRPVIGSDGKPTTSALLHGTRNGEHLYAVALTRDLRDNEVEEILSAFNTLHPDLEVEVEASAPADLVSASDTIEVPTDRLTALCRAWAKAEHERWVEARMASGWRWGPVMSVSRRTHPLLRPWDDLPEKYRNIDPDRPRALLDLLGEQGFCVIDKGELDAVLRLLRSVA